MQIFKTERQKQADEYLELWAVHQGWSQDIQLCLVLRFIDRYPELYDDFVDFLVGASGTTLTEIYEWMRQKDQDEHREVKNV